jgi:hypothetical protein
MRSPSPSADLAVSTRTLNHSSGVPQPLRQRQRRVLLLLPQGGPGGMASRRAKVAAGPGLGCCVSDGRRGRARRDDSRPGQGPLTGARENDRVLVRGRRHSSERAESDPPVRSDFRKPHGWIDPNVQAKGLLMEERPRSPGIGLTLPRPLPGAHRDPRCLADRRSLGIDVPRHRRALRGRR